MWILKRTTFPRYWILVLAALTAISLGTVTISKAQDSVSRATIELFRGADKNDMEMVKRAIYAGADVRARNSLGQRAHDVAVDLNHMEVAHYILSMRPKARKQPIQQRTVQTTLPTASQIAAKKLPPPVKPLAVKKPKSVAPKPVITKPTSSAVAIRKPAPKVAPIAIAKQMPKPAPKIALVSPAREVKKTAPVSIVKPVQSRQLKPVAKKVPREAAAIPAVKRKPEPMVSVALASPAPEAGKPASAAPTINATQPGEFNFFGNRNTVFSYGRCTKRFVQDDISTFRPQSDFDRVRQLPPQPCRFSRWLPGLSEMPGLRMWLPYRQPWF